MDVFIIAVAGVFASRSAAVHVCRSLVDMGRSGANIAGVLTRYFGLGLTMLTVGARLGMPAWVGNAFFVSLVVWVVILLGYAFEGKERVRAQFPMAWYRSGTRRMKRMTRRTDSMAARQVMEARQVVLSGTVIEGRGTV